MAIVGTAYIATKVISTGLAKELEKSFQDAFNQAKPALKQMGDEAGKEMGGAISDAVGDSVKDAEPDLKRAGEDIGRTMGEATGDSHRRTLDDSIRDTDWVGKWGPDFKGFGQKIGSAFGDGFNDEHKSKLKESLEGIGKWAGTLVSMAKPWGIAIGVSFGEALASQAIALIGAIGPAFVSAAAAGTAAIASLAVAGGALLLALTTASPMLDRFKEVSAAIKEEFSEIGLAVQETLLPNLGLAMGNLTAVIPVVKDGMAAVGEEIGKVAVGFSEMVTSAENLERIRGIVDGTSSVTRDFGGALTNVGEMFFIVANAAMPLLQELAAFTNGVTANWVETLKAKEASGELADTLKRGWEVLKQLGTIIGAVGTGLFNIFRAGSDEGQNLLDKIEEIALKFENWTSSVEGQNALSDWFAQGEGTAQTFYDLMGEIGDSLLELLDAFGRLGEQMAENGSLGLMVDIFTGFLDVLTAIMGIPVLGDIVSFLVALAPMVPILMMMVNIFSALSTVFTVLQVVVVSLGIAFGVSFWWIIAIIAAIVAIIAIIVLAIKHWDDIKAVVLDVWEKIKDAIGVAWDWIKSIFDKITDALKAVGDWFADIWEAISTAVGNAIDAVINFIQPLIDFFKKVVEVYFSAFVAFWTFIFDLIMLPVKLFIALVIWVWEQVKNAFTDAWNAVSGWISEKWNKLKEMLSGPLNAAKDAISQAWTNVKTAFSDAWNAVTGWISEKWNSLKDKLAKPLQDAKNLILDIWESIKEKGTAVWDAIVGAVQGAIQGVKNAINGIIDIINGIINGINKLIDGVNTLPGPDLVRIPKISRLAKGGVVSPSQFGTMAMIAEAGKPERVEPLDSDGLSKRDRAILAKMGSGPTEVRVFIGNQELTQIVRVEQERRDALTAHSLGGGRALAYGGV